MKEKFTKENFEHISDFDFTEFTIEQWDSVVLKLRTFLTEYKFVEMPTNVSLCVLKGEPMIVVDLLAQTKQGEYEDIQLSFTAFCVELWKGTKATYHEELTHAWRNIMGRKFEKYNDALEDHLTKVGL